MADDGFVSPAVVNNKAKARDYDTKKYLNTAYFNAGDTKA